MPAAAPVAAAEGSQPCSRIEITDCTGNTVSLKDLPERVVLAGKATVMIQDAVFLFKEAEERVVALENRRQSALRFLRFVDPNVSGKTFFDVNAGPEQIASVKPDLVIMKNFMAGSLGRSLKKIDIPVLYLDLETPGAFFRDIRTLGKVFGNRARAEKIVGFYRSGMARVKKAVSDAAEKPEVLLIEHKAQGRGAAFGVPPVSWIQTRLVELAGGRPVWKDLSVSGGWRIVTVEQVAAWDPDQIFLIDYQGRAESAAAALKKDPIWAGLRAVKNNQLYAFPFDFYSWDQPDTRWILGLQWLACRINPEAADKIDIKDEVKRFYRVLYRMSPEMINSEVLPRLRGDFK